ncbi:MAG: hypothetical protein KA603_11330 [Azonexus sp.]|nr:hypothetical protein [Betaproteobacteria bacterium]MBK8919048.1 hypothetical protein [Betaproteobacteria bacterium]MBP6036717.1 hypothetical protein [Azonexus sp.]MBP6905500.1 hypothetical protein [Azonexus sp.]
MKSLLTALALATSLIAPAHAGSLVDVQVIDRSTGQTLETWRHQGRLYVAGTPGNRYAINLGNKSGGRVLTVLSVDGVNAVSGETAAVRQTGYVLTPGQSAEIAGWRKSQDEVAAFYFTSVADSYASRSDRPRNVGVIGVAVFREMEPPKPVLLPAPLASREKAEAADSAAATGAVRGEAKAAQAPAAESRLGTGHGERIAARSEFTEFGRASEQPSEVIAIYYDSRANLMARGIIPGTPMHGRPNPFPGGFVPDPKG